MNTLANCIHPAILTFPASYRYTPPIGGRMAVIDSGAGKVWLVTIAETNSAKKIYFWWRGSKEEITQRLSEWERVQVEERPAIDDHVELYEYGVLLMCPGG